MNSAHEIPGAITVLFEIELEGKLVIETGCADYEAFSRLPNAVSYNGKTLGKTGWNSDSGKACYKEGAKIALKVIKPQCQNCPHCHTGTCPKCGCKECIPLH